MLCGKCGRELRPGARFCNNCGAPAPNAAGQTAGQSGGTQPDGPSRPPLPPLSAVSAGQERASAASSRPGGPGGPGASVTTQLAPAAEQDTVARKSASASPFPGRGPGQQANGSSGALGGFAPAPDDQLPWPLPPGIIIDGRYRVEAMLSSDDQENVYAVTDLRGYEQCWACGQAYGASAASERFCRECGADMLGRELLMRERAQPEGTAPRASVDARGPQVADDADARTFTQNARLYRVAPKATPRAAFPRGARLVAGSATDLGRHRSGEVNEDSALVIVLDRVHEDRSMPFGIFAMADGMGGHANGHRASRLVLNVLAHTILRQVALPLVGTPTEPAVDESHLANVLRDAVRAANNTLCAANKETKLDAGSTLVAALVYGETAYIANVGDSRCYVCDEQGLRRITSDHSLVQQLVAGGLIEPDDVYTHPERNKIFRSLGDDPDVIVDLFVQQLRPGLRLLLCSDGLWEMVRDPQIEAALRAEPDPQSACDALMAAANEGGGEDNITAVIVAAR